MSLFISFEGGEGSGKTTQTKLLDKKLRNLGFSVTLVREPGSTDLGRYLRKWLKSDKPLCREAELFLFAAARSELVDEIVRPDLKRGKIVIADRYADSTIAYQGYGRKLPLKDVEVINRLATQQILPDLTFFLDLLPEEGLARLHSLQLDLLSQTGDTGTRGRQEDEEQQKFEKESLEFHKRVRDGYHKLAKSDPKRWCVINGALPLDDIAEVIFHRVQVALKHKGLTTTQEVDVTDILRSNPVR